MLAIDRVANWINSSINWISFTAPPLGRSGSMESLKLYFIVPNIATPALRTFSKISQIYNPYYLFILFIICRLVVSFPSRLQYVVLQEGRKYVSLGSAKRM